MIGYLNDLPDRAMAAVPCYQTEQAPLGSLLSETLGVELHTMVEKSRAMVRVTRVDDVFVMPCPNQKTRDVLSISTLGLLIVQNLLDDP